jgi:hypothetical protein
METEHTVNGISHEWEEGDIAIVLRYMVSGSASRWAVIEMRANRDQDGILRWRDGRFLYQGAGISYSEAVALCIEQAEKIGGKVPVFRDELGDPALDEEGQRRNREKGGPGSMLVGQWRHGDFVKNRKNRILRTLKEDL